ncbi:hypothetical protein HNP99_002639 [Flavobacterium sp. 28A]|uniref:LamG-like jellyroll fold domain-containing protein n=1 Tax=Flavobacterium sp. 28A TaxID=2735895 RepID=UPI0015704239|nr:LamG-like jellyroll fold domain-containing protein [Flavobacterium sp. 28A]NRT16275.1 hypothetical protein [Flavobacterium sp. 28A]
MKKIFLFLLLIPFFGIAQLSGSFTINTANPDSNFKTLAAAVARINSVGISGPVVFLVDEDQVVNSQIVIGQIAGSSVTNTLTIKPNIGKTVSVTADMLNSSTGVAAVFMFNGAKNVVIDGSSSAAGGKDLTLVNNDGLSYTDRSIIWIASNGSISSSNITVTNCNLKFTNRNQQLTLCTGVYSGNNGFGGNNRINVEAATAANSSVLVLNNLMINVKDAVYINGSGTASLSPSNWKISGNSVGSTISIEKPIRAFYLLNALNYEVSGNKISGINNTANNGNDTAGIVLLGSSAGLISANYIDDIVNSIYKNGLFTAGILVKSTGVTNIFNNIISNVNVSTADPNNYNYYNKGNGIFVTSGSMTNIFFNTIVMKGAPASTAYASGVYITGGSNINLRSNIFVNTLTNRQYAVFNNGGTFGAVNYNDYYVSNATNNFSNRINSIEYIGTAGFTSWNQAVTDSNSKSINPLFTSITDFHLQSTGNDNLQGVLITEITTDIDGQNRAKPYMGADEICTAPSITTQPVAPTATCPGNGTQTITVVATNATSFQWRKDGVNLSNGGVVSGATSATLTLSNPTSANEGAYDVVVSNSCPAAINSNSITISIIPDPIVSATIVDASCSNTSGGSINLINPESAIEFRNADNDYIDLGNSFSLSNRNAFTLEGWVKFNKADIGSRYSLFGQNDVIEFGFTNTNTILLWTAGGGSITTTLTTTFGNNAWHHIAAVGTGSNLRIYIDGVLIASGGSTTTNYGSNTTFTPKIGAGVIDASGGGFTGQIKKVGMYSSALSAAAIATLASSTTQYTGTESGLLAGYNFSEGVGTSLTKLPVGVNGTFQNSPEWNYKYSWTKVGTPSFTATNRNINALSAGTYNLTLTPLGVGCVVTKSFTVGGGSAVDIPTIGIITQPTCAAPTGSVVLSGLPATGNWTINPGAITGTGATTTVSGLTAGTTYTFTVSNGSCTSGSSSNAVVNTVQTVNYNGSTWSGIPDLNKIGVITGTGTISSDVDLCSCTVNAGVQATVASGKTLKLQNQLTVNGTMIFNDLSSLVQINDAAVNTGNITYKRQTPIVTNFDYTYWSSPVKNQKLIDFSPTTLGDKFLSFDSTINNWKYEDAYNTTMVAGKGYIIRGPQENYAPGPINLYEPSFIGEPINGVVSVAIGGTRVSNLIGNPYPSALNADAFLTANNSVLSGTLYFWTHNTSIQLASNITNGTAGSGSYAYTSDDYASYNLTGGTGTRASISSGPNTSIPDGQIAAGQGFFGTSIAPGTAMFNNAMRLKAGAIIDNSKFFRLASTSKTTVDVEKNRLWLNLVNDQGAFKQTLVGYITGATNEYESAYDGSSFNANAYINFYSLLSTSAMAIQGRALPFDENDTVPLGYKSNIAGDFKIAIDQVDGLFTSQVVYLEDKLLNVIHNLKESPYAFTTEIGVFNERFAILYANKTLGTDDFDTLNNTVFVATNNKEITITASVELIDKVFVYDFSGRQLYSKIAIDSNEVVVKNLTHANGALIVKVVLNNGKMITRKIVY